MEIELGSLFFGFADLQIEADTADEFGWQVNRQESKPKMSITNLKWEFDLDLGIICLGVFEGKAPVSNCQLT